MDPSLAKNLFQSLTLIASLLVLVFGALAKHFESKAQKVKESERRLLEERLELATTKVQQLSSRTALLTQFNSEIDRNLQKLDLGIKLKRPRQPKELSTLTIRLELRCFNAVYELTVGEGAIIENGQSVPIPALGIRGGKKGATASELRAVLGQPMLHQGPIDRLSWDVIICTPDSFTNKVRALNNTIYDLYVSGPWADEIEGFIIQANDWIVTREYGDSFRSGVARRFDFMPNGRDLEFRQIYTTNPNDISVLRIDFFNRPLTKLIYTKEGVQTWGDPIF